MIDFIEAERKTFAIFQTGPFLGYLTFYLDTPFNKGNVPTKTSVQIVRLKYSLITRSIVVKVDE